MGGFGVGVGGCGCEVGCVGDVVRGGGYWYGGFGEWVVIVLVVVVGRYFWMWDELGLVEEV